LKELLDIVSKSISPDVNEKIASIVENDIPESMQYIYSSTKKMDLLLAGLLRLSRIGRTELKKTRINMNDLMSAVMRTFEFQLKKGSVKVDVQELPPCTGDEMQLDRVFSNLIDNAIKYADTRHQCMVKISGYSDSGNSVYCVEDNGLGIAPDYQEKIFEIFQQLEPDRFKGEGLGLTIAHRIVEMHRGRIWIESDVGKGTKFFVSLPA
jgi:signal transduction histidine kinase